MFPLGKAIIFAPGNASKSRSVAANVHSCRMILGFYQFGILRADAWRNIAFALINQMTTSQTRLRTSPIAALVNRVVPLTFTLVLYHRVCAHQPITNVADRVENVPIAALVNRVVPLTFTVCMTSEGRVLSIFRTKGGAGGSTSTADELPQPQKKLLERELKGDRLLVARVKPKDNWFVLSSSQLISSVEGRVRQTRLADIMGVAPNGHTTHSRSRASVQIGLSEVVSHCRHCGI